MREGTSPQHDLSPKGIPFRFCHVGKCPRHRLIAISERARMLPFIRSCGDEPREVTDQRKVSSRFGVWTMIVSISVSL